MMLVKVGVGQQKNIFCGKEVRMVPVRVKKKNGKTF